MQEILEALSLLLREGRSVVVIRTRLAHGSSPTFTWLEQFSPINLYFLHYVSAMPINAYYNVVLSPGISRPLRRFIYY